MRIEVKNLIGVSLSIFLSFGAFTAVFSLASTLHEHDGLASFTLLFFGTAFVCLFSPAIVAKFGTKFVVWWLVCYGG